MRPLDLLRDLNARVNRAIQYREEKRDHWQTPVETYRRGAGDCEDFAIVKMAELLALGWDPDIVRLVYCRRRIGRIQQAHMVLEVHAADEPRVLDNLGLLVNRWGDRGDLQPVFSFNAVTLWLRGRPSHHHPQRRIGLWRDCIARAKAQGTDLGDQP